MHIFRSVQATVVAGIVAAATIPAASAGAATTPGRQDIRITFDSRVPSGLAVSTTTVQEGPITFRIGETYGYGVLLFQLNPGVTMAQLDQDIQDVNDDAGADPAVAVAGYRAMIGDAVFYGLPYAVPGRPSFGTLNLAHGTYYLAPGYFGASYGATDRPPLTLRVNPSVSINPTAGATPTPGTGPGADVVGGLPTVSMTSNNRFSIQGHCTPPARCCCATCPTR